MSKTPTMQQNMQPCINIDRTVCNHKSKIRASMPMGKSKQKKRTIKFKLRSSVHPSIENTSHEAKEKVEICDNTNIKETS
jgi:hypothetical protein